MSILFLVIGLVLLIYGAELLVKGASRLATRFGISPLVIGLTVVAFGTSSPEMAVSIAGAIKDEADIAVGNVLGSNIFNVLFILGSCALILPLKVNQKLVKVDVPIMIGISLLLFLMALDQELDRIDGLILFSGLIAYTGFLLFESLKEKKEIIAEYEQGFGEGKEGKPSSIVMQIVYVISGLVLLVIGSNFLVENAKLIATYLSVSDEIIALTIVAAGTSLPEVATSVTASIRGERDIAVGNVVGSNIFNILGVAGISAIVSPYGLSVAPELLSLDFPVMTAVAVACLPVFFTGTIARWQGGIFLGYYMAYTVYLILVVTQNQSLESFRTAMLWFVIPITILTLLIIPVRMMQSKWKSASGNAQPPAP